MLGRRQLFGLLLTVVFVLSASSVLAVDYGEFYFKFKTPPRHELDKISRLISIDQVTADEVHAYANNAELARFQQLGIAYELLPHPGTLIHPQMSAAKGVEAAWDSYPTYDAYLAIMNQFQTDFPDLCRIVNVGTSADGRALLFARISHNVAIQEDEPEVMFTSSMHGDETTGYILCLRLIDSLLHGYGSDPYVTRLVDSLEIWINPLANPDGTYYSGNNDIYGARRYNANGVDINRNFPDPAAGDHPDGNSWQPETQAMMAFAQAHSFIISANFHGGAEVINYPWDTWSRAHADESWYVAVCLAWAQSAQAASPSNYMESYQFPNGITNGYAWYRVTGGRQDYMNYWRGCREITAEISNTKLLPAAQLPDLWSYNRVAMMAYLENALYGIRGLVTDAVTSLPIAATVRVIGHDADNSQVYTDPDVGDYHRVLYHGSYTLAFSSLGYESDTVTGITVTNGQSTHVDVALQPLSGTPDLAFAADDVDLVKRNDNVSMAITLVNNGGGNATAVSATLQTSDPNVQITQSTSTFPTIAGAGGTGTSATDYVFQVNASCPLNHVAQMQLLVTASGGYNVTLPVSVLVEPVAENFESGGFAMLPWTEGGAQPWTIALTDVGEGAYSARSGVISHSQSSLLTVQVDVAETGRLWFDFDVSSEAGYDFLRFLIDGSEIRSWSGDIAWNRVSFDIPPGVHTFAWEYSKDEGVSEGADRAAIDRIIFPPLTSHLDVATLSLPSWTVGRPYDIQLEVSGRLGLANWTDKNLDLATSGLTLSSGGQLSGTPAGVGQIAFTARVEDAAGVLAERALSITVNTTPTISTISLTDAKKDQAYSTQLEATGGTAPMAWAETSGALTGTGLALTASGLLEGIPNLSSTLNLQLRVTDVAGAQNPKTLDLTISGGCCTGIVGDANMAGGDEPTIGDIATMIDMLFISGQPVACLAEADVNQSGGADPIADDITIGDISMLIDHLFISGVELPTCL